MSSTVTVEENKIHEKQLLKLEKFSEVSEVDLLDIHDPLDELLSMDLGKVMQIVKDAYDFYVEEENCKPQVAKIKAIQEVSLWYYGNDNKEISLRKLVKEL